MSAVARLADRRFLRCEVTPAAGVRLVGERLVDDHTGASIGLNTTAAQAVAALASGASMVEVCAAAQERFPGAPVTGDLLRLVRDLNATGLLDVVPSRAGSAFGAVLGAAAPAWAAPVVRWLDRLLGRAIAMTFTRRRQLPWPRGAVALAVSVAGCLLPLVTLGLFGAGVAAVCDWGHVAEIACGTAALVLSVVAHELGHAVTLGGPDVGYVSSLGGVRVLVGRHQRGRRWRAAVAGPLAGAGVAVVTVVAGVALRSGPDVAAGLVLGLSHLLSLAPWSADGRLLRSPSGSTSTPDTVRT